MYNANLNLSYQASTDQLSHSLVTTDGTLTPFLQVQHGMALATDEQHKTAHYGMARLAAELRRQSQIIARKGGVTPEEKLKLQSLTLECMAKLQEINVRLNDRLVHILSQ
jgi:hypothetical protein